MTSDAEFLAKIRDTRAVPVRPALTPTIAKRATAAEIDQANRTHKIKIQQYHLHQIVTQALKKLVTKNIEEIYHGELDLSMVTILDLITYLKTRYYCISSAELNQNDQELQSAWDDKASVEAYFQRLKLCTELAHNAQQVNDLTEKQLIQVMFVQMQCIAQIKQAN